MIPKETYLWPFKSTWYQRVIEKQGWYHEEENVIIYEVNLG